MSAGLATRIVMRRGRYLPAPSAWLEGVAGIVWRPLTDVRIEIRTAVAWRAENRSALLRALVAELPTAEAAPAS